MKKDKLKLAIVDLTDCEGCQVEFFGLEDQFPLIWQRFDIVSWRLMQDKSDLHDIDVLLIEGCPITEEEREEIKELRQKATLVGTLGSCADLGGINSILTPKERLKAFKKVYRKNRPIKRQTKPVSDFIDVDFKIPGCPTRPAVIAQVLAQILQGNVPQPQPYPVCFECKKNNNDCLLLNGEPCLGPITAGGCKAICPSQNHACYGCFGLLEGAQVNTMMKLLEKKVGKKEADQIRKIFLNNQIKKK